MKYKVTVDNYGFMGRYWDAGTIVDLDESLKPPEHFVPLDTKQDIVTEGMSDAQKVQRKKKVV